MKEKKKYFIPQYSHEDYIHGGIGYRDAESILRSGGYQKLELPGQGSSSLLKKISRLLYILQQFLFIPGGSTIVFLSPVYARMVRFFILLLAKRKNLRIICFIADIDGLKDGDPALLKKEIDFFRQFDRFIVHNERMRSWLHAVIGNVKTAEIEFFDFLVAASDARRELSFRIVFAGNLGKSLFLEKMDELADRSPLLEVELFGPGATPAMKNSRNLHWKGIFSPGELPHRLQASFGLVWDGDAIDGLKGVFGDYQRYISPHKLSLYILSGLPLIVPAGAASSILIKKYRIGIEVEDFFELGQKIAALDEKEYNQMRENLRPLAERIRGGEGLTRSLAMLDG